jgi:NADPH:quinone reductase-like Zn-dependent oxidoreductase/NAD(P)-dependent dehydrogenase (short-subunit alcohol dehydrogenase family)/acyl carrier protein
MGRIEQPLKMDLGDLAHRDAEVPFVSTVTGACMPGARVDAKYWWRNVRDPVHFVDAVRAAAELGVRYFVEIGPRPTLLKHVTDSLAGEINGVGVTAVLDRDQDDLDPFAKARAKAIVAGAQVDVHEIFGPDPGPAVTLPHYPWQQTPFRFKPTAEAIDNEPQRHPLAGARTTSDGLIWRAHIDTALYPYLLDHRLGDQVIFPGTGFIEIALAVGKEWLKTDVIVLRDFEILNPLDLTAGETREVMTRVSPGSGTLEIFSRPRLSQASWLIHVRTKVLPGNAPDSVSLPARTGRSRSLSATDVYGIASESGINYGPAFSLARQVCISDNGGIEVELAAGSDIGSFLLDPMRLDAGGHGFFGTFSELRAVERGVTYIPVRLKEVALYRPHLTPVRTMIRITRKSDRAIVGDSYYLDREGAIIAVLRGVRSQAVTVRRRRSLVTTSIVETPRLIDGTILGKTGVAATTSDLITLARQKNLLSKAKTIENESEMLLEGWALAAASEMAFALCPDGEVKIEGLVAEGRLPTDLRFWAANLFMRLQAAGLAERTVLGWRLIKDRSLPRAETVSKALATEQQFRAAEIALVSTVDALVTRVASGETQALRQASLSKPVLDYYHKGSCELHAVNNLIERLISDAKGIWPSDRVLRVLQIGYGQLSRSLATLEHEMALTVFEPDRPRYESAALDTSRMRGVQLVDTQHIADLKRYDLILSPAGLHRLPESFGALDMCALLDPKGLLIAVEPATSLFKELVFGLVPGWFVPNGDGSPRPRLLGPSSWAAVLSHGGFRNVEAHPVQLGAGQASLIVAEAASASGRMLSASRVVSEKAASLLVIAGPEESRIADKLAANFKAGNGPKIGFAVSRIEIEDQFPAEAPAEVIYLHGEPDEPLEPSAALTKRCLNLKHWAERIGNAPIKLWLVFSGALGGSRAEAKPVETAAWAFTRTLANEFPKLDVRRIDIAPDVDPDKAAAVIEQIVLSGTAETELAYDGDTLRAVRMERLERTFERSKSDVHGAARLERRSTGGERLSWQPIERKAPACGEVEIEVEAIGLNFRDLMFSMSLLPEDMLEDGFSGPTLGLECAGRIAKIGSGVTDLNVGDRVMAFAASSFATHVTVQRRQAVRLPEQLTIDAAATVPVAFFTAYYSLISKAKLRRGEWVLIHGGAGAVGMAAIQIGQWKKARVIATAGSPAKRELLRSLGVHHVLDSRSTTFVDDVRRITGEGVDIVLNSLAGDAMEWSIACLRPFGRFIELGKRDYVSNTHIGLRPFRHNLSYFGIDVDQVIGARRAEAERIFAQIVRLFEKGTFTALPYSVFDSAHVAEAFHLMQQSSHIGKILVRPPAAIKRPAVVKPFVVSPDKTHIITGAFGGFGLESAKWLVEKGARYLVLIGRNGAATVEAQSVVQDLARRGAKVIAEPCDVTDLASLQSLFQRVSLYLPPIAGVLHEAMVLDDAILANLDEERFRSVFAPKVIGADNLDAVLRGQSLDYFVLFSSVTTLIGNPGQANYVAANAYMEGLARLRRSKGLPALAIGWGPILDVGVVARNEKLQSGLRKLTGVSGLRAREALDLMAEALVQPPDFGDGAVITIAPNEGGFAAERLAVLRSPTYSELVSANRGDTEAAIDLHALAAREGVEAARRKVADVINSQLAHVLHLREEDISRVRPLGEIGLDSLMALELLMNLEERFGLKVPLSGSSGGMTINDIANEIIAHVGLERDDDDAMIEVTAVQHQKELDREQLKAVKTIMIGESRGAKRLLS